MVHRVWGVLVVDSFPLRPNPRPRGRMGGPAVASWKCSTCEGWWLQEVSFEYYEPHMHFCGNYFLNAFHWIFLGATFQRVSTERILATNLLLSNQTRLPPLQCTYYLEIPDPEWDGTPEVNAFEIFHSVEVFMGDGVVHIYMVGEEDEEPNPDLGELVPSRK